jgi:hypothetical protein
MSKINIVRSIKSKNIRENDYNNSRELGWDNRINIQKQNTQDQFHDTYRINK